MRVYCQAEDRSGFVLLQSRDQTRRRRRLSIYRSYWALRCWGKRLRRTGRQRDALATWSIPTHWLMLREVRPRATSRSSQPHFGRLGCVAHPLLILTLTLHWQPPTSRWIMGSK